jgi:NAD(P)-dependent dehydrogenase (short-subunit alcohol dehydrogenase family)
LGNSLKGKTAIVVGSGQGIGRAIAIGMAKEGAKVITNNRKRGSTGYAMVEDKHREAVGKEQSQWLEKEVDAIKGDAETTAQQIRDMGGEAVAFFGDVIKHAEYCAANAGVYGLTKAVAIEMLEHGITCNAISPFAKTRASYELETLSDGSEDGKKVWLSGKGMSFLDITPGPEFVAPFVCYLASDAAGAISGSIFQVGGNGIGMYSEPFISHNLTKPGPEPWTVKELVQQVPGSLLQGYKTPAKPDF